MLELTLPRMTDKMVSGRLVAWLRHEGDRLEMGTPTCLVETDGSVLTVGAAVAGVLSRIVAQAGSLLPVGGLLGYVAPPDGQDGSHGAKKTGRQATAEASSSPDALTRGLWGPSGDPLNSTSRRTAGFSHAEAASPAMFPGTVFVEVDMSDAVAVRERLMGQWEKNSGVPLSLNHMVLKATALALKEHPEVFSGGMRYGSRSPGQVDLGVCIFDGGSVVTPVIRDAAGLPLVEISVQMASFGERAAEHRLANEDDPDVTVTVANLGRYGADVALLSGSPKTAVLGVGRCVRKPVVVNDDLKFRWMMVLSLSFDGRMIDGARASQFIGVVKGILEQPEVLVQ